MLQVARPGSEIVVLNNRHKFRFRLLLAKWNRKKAATTVDTFFKLKEIVQNSMKCRRLRGATNNLYLVLVLDFLTSYFMDGARFCPFLLMLVLHRFPSCCSYYVTGPFISFCIPLFKGCNAGQMAVLIFKQ